MYLNRFFLQEYWVSSQNWGPVLALLQLACNVSLRASVFSALNRAFKLPLQLKTKELLFVKMWIVNQPRLKPQLAANE